MNPSNWLSYFWDPDQKEKCDFPHTSIPSSHSNKSSAPVNILLPKGPACMVAELSASLRSGKLKTK